MGGERHPSALRIGRIVGRVAFVRIGERRAARLFPADDLLLLDERGAIPALDEHADDPDHLIGSPRRPGGFVGIRLHPDDLIDQRLVAGVEVGGAVLESEQVANRLLAELLDRVGRQEAVNLPAQSEKIGRAPEDVAQRVDVRFGGVRAELQNDVAVAVMRASSASPGNCSMAIRRVGLTFCSP